MIFSATAPIYAHFKMTSCLHKVLLFLPSVQISFPDPFSQAISLPGSLVSSVASSASPLSALLTLFPLLLLTALFEKDSREKAMLLLP